MKKTVIILLLIFLLSCRSSRRIVIDDYFALINNINESSNIDIISTDEISNYFIKQQNNKAIYVSPLIGNIIKSLEIKSNATVINFFSNDVKLSKNIFLNNENAFSEIVALIESMNINNLCLIVDSSLYDKSSFKIFFDRKNINSELYLLEDRINIDALNGFINKKTNCEAWIVFSDKIIEDQISLLKDSFLIVKNGSIFYPNSLFIDYYIEIEWDSKNLINSFDTEGYIKSKLKIN